MPPKRDLLHLLGSGTPCRFQAVLRSQFVVKASRIRERKLEVYEALLAATSSPQARPDLLLDASDVLQLTRTFLETGWNVVFSCLLPDAPEEAGGGQDRAGEGASGIACAKGLGPPPALRRSARVAGPSGTGVALLARLAGLEALPQ
mmetsp:Transcript_64144/g.202948  ORF Transcript_64144/g.202948 Transcript_64144/m.202948 type:complete len:147 (+) Transcript_64144:637-1077(+)